MMSTAAFMDIWITTLTLIKRLRKVASSTVELHGFLRVLTRHSRTRSFSMRLLMDMNF